MKLRLFFVLYTETPADDDKLSVLFQEMADEHKELDDGKSDKVNEGNGNVEAVVEQLVNLACHLTTDLLRQEVSII